MPFFVGTAATNDVFTIWTNQTSAVTTATIWTSWVETQSATNSIFYGEQQQQLDAQQIAALQQAHAVQMSQMQAQMERERERQNEVNERALALLMEFLTEEQRREYRERDCFHVRARSGRRYRIKTSMVSGNVEALDERGEVTERLCAHDRRHGTPRADQWLAQKFYLEHHEEEFLRLANRH